MAQQQDSTNVTPAQVIQALRAIIPADCYVLFTPYDSMFVSPDPQQIKSSIEVLVNQVKGTT